MNEIGKAFKECRRKRAYEGVTWQINMNQLVRLANVEGSEPVKELRDKSTWIRFVCLANSVEGSEPVNKLYAKFTWISLVRLAKLDGIEPFKLHSLRVKVVRLGKLVNKSWSATAKRLLWCSRRKEREWSCVNDFTKGPSRLQSTMLKELRLGKYDDTMWLQFFLSEEEVILDFGQASPNLEAQD